jgi:small nuclear ribonucleoprotein (snRNP)-like protein
MDFKQRLLAKKEAGKEIEIITSYAVIIGHIQEVDNQTVVVLQKTIRSITPLETTTKSEDKQAQTVEHIETEITIRLKDIHAISDIISKKQL